MGKSFNRCWKLPGSVPALRVPVWISYLKFPITVRKIAWNSLHFELLWQTFNSWDCSVNCQISAVISHFSVSYYRELRADMGGIADAVFLECCSKSSLNLNESGYSGGYYILILYLRRSFSCDDDENRWKLSVTHFSRNTYFTNFVPGPGITVVPVTASQRRMPAFCLHLVGQR